MLGRRITLGICVLILTSALARAEEPAPAPSQQPQQQTTVEQPAAEPAPGAEVPPTVEQCDDAFEACLIACEKSMPGVSGEMLCTGCGWDCNVVHKKCLGRAYYHKVFGKEGT